MTWEVEIADPSFERFFRALDEYRQAALVAAIEGVLARDGIDICSSGWGKALGGGLYEFRVGRSPNSILGSAGRARRTGRGFDRPVLLRIFCAFHGRRVVVLFHGYDKGAAPSKSKQAREIATARRIHDAWQRSVRQSRGPGR
jgi:hypothetical protein